MCLKHQGGNAGSPTAENDGGNWYTTWIIQTRRDTGALTGWRCESRVRVGRLAIVCRPEPALPVDQAGGRLAADSFPPWLAVGSECHVGEQAVVIECGNCIWITRWTGSRRDTEEPCLGIYRPQSAVVTDAKPRDVVTHCPNLVTL